MRKLIVTILLMLTISLASVVMIPQDVGNHMFLGASISKVLDNFTKNDEELFWIMSAIFIGKEVLDMDGTGFSINDLAYDYIGYWLVKGEITF